MRGELAAGVVDPGFGGDELEREAEPEGSTEEVVGSEMREAAGGEKDADDWADGGKCPKGWTGHSNGVRGHLMSNWKYVRDGQEITLDESEDVLDYRRSE